MRLLIAGMPRWFWTMSVVLLFAGCSGSSYAVGTMDLSSFIGSIPGLIAAVVGISQAYAIKMKATAAVETAEAETESAVARALLNRDIEVTQLRLLVEAAIGREHLCQRRLDALDTQFKVFREEYLSQRNTR